MASRRSCRRDVRITEADVAKGVGQFHEEYAIPAESFARAVAFAIVMQAGTTSEIELRVTGTDALLVKTTVHVIGP